MKSLKERINRCINRLHPKKQLKLILERNSARKVAAIAFDLRGENETFYLRYNYESRRAIKRSS